MDDRADIYASNYETDFLKKVEAAPSIGAASTF
jgi:hypothetical protein